MQSLGQIITGFDRGILQVTVCVSEVTGPRIEAFHGRTEESADLAAKMLKYIDLHE
jgi:hypothetical protein